MLVHTGVTSIEEQDTGEELREQLEALARDFDRVAVPEQGKYVPAGMPV